MNITAAAETAPTTSPASPRKSKPLLPMLLLGLGVADVSALFPSTAVKVKSLVGLGLVPEVSPDAVIQSSSSSSHPDPGSVLDGGRGWGDMGAADSVVDVPTGFSGGGVIIVSPGTKISSSDKTSRKQPMN